MATYSTRSPPMREAALASMDNADKRHLVTSQPCTEEVKKIKCMLREWEDEIKRSEGPAKEDEHLQSYTLW